MDSAPSYPVHYATEALPPKEDLVRHNVYVRDLVSALLVELEGRGFEISFLTQISVSPSSAYTASH